jgi:hypothetical protein
LKHVQELARTYSPQAIETLVQIAMSGASEQARLAASNAILDRAFGKAAQRLGRSKGTDTHQDDGTMKRFVVRVPHKASTTEEWARNLKRKPLKPSCGSRSPDRKPS